MTPEAAAWRRRDLSGTCPTCHAAPGQPCRRTNRPHRDRLLTAIFGARP